MIDRSRYKEIIYYEGLAQVIMEAEKSPDLLSGSWRPRKAGGIHNSSTIRRPEKQGSQWCISQSQEGRRG